MSHFTVLVKLTPEDLEGVDIETAVSNMLRPYQENNMEDCPKEFLQWNDVLESCRKSWENDTYSAVVSPTGEVRSKYDEEFRDRSTGFLERNKYVYPDGWIEKELPLKERYPNLKDYIEDYEGYRWDEDMQSYGYWENPNAKWDWWVIGGRWKNSLLHKNGRKCDVVSVGNLDIETMNDCEADIQEFLEDHEIYLHLIDAKKVWPEGEFQQKSQAFMAEYGLSEERFQTINFWHRSRLIDRGLLITSRNTEDGVEIHKEVNYEILAGPLRHSFEFSTWAVVDKKGWREKGEMGWFGCGSDTPDSRKEFETSFLERETKDLPPGSLIAVVDCHI